MNAPNTTDLGVFSFLSGNSGMSGEKIITPTKKENKPINAIILLALIIAKTKREKAIA